MCFSRAMLRGVRSSRIDAMALCGHACTKSVDHIHHMFSRSCIGSRDDCSLVHLGVKSQLWLTSSLLKLCHRSMVGFLQSSLPAVTVGSGPPFTGSLRPTQLMISYTWTYNLHWPHVYWETGCNKWKASRTSVTPTSLYCELNPFCNYSQVLVPHCGMDAWLAWEVMSGTVHAYAEFCLNLLF